MGMTSAFDLDAYLDRIGFSGPRPATLETLRRLHFCHAGTIPFENLNPLMGWPVDLDVASLQNKLIHKRRGGYCYEQNLLFKHALEAVGFNVVGLAARVSWNTPQSVVLPRTHMLLQVTLGGEAYIADVGFGGPTLTAPLRLVTNVAQTTPHEPFRLTTAGAEFMLEAEIGSSWKPLYRFTLQEQLLPDYEVANWWVSANPKSLFVNSLIAARAAEGRRYTLLNNEFAVHYLDGRTDRRTLGTVAEICEILEDPFGLMLPENPELGAALRRLSEKIADAI